MPTSKYNILSDSDFNEPVKDFSYHQKVPSQRCTKYGWYLSKSNAKGAICRCWRCSPQCSRNMARKVSAAITERSSGLPEMKFFRGSLSLPKDAGPEVHSRVKEGFRRRLNYIRKRDGCTLAMFMVLHITDKHNAHYDYVAYTDLSQTKVEEIIRHAWKQSGGVRPTCTFTRRSGVEGWGRYIVKADESFKLLPVKRGEPGYLEVTWEVGGFWGGESVDTLWKRVWQRTHGADGGDRLQLENTILGQQTDPQTHSEPLENQPQTPSPTTRLEATEAIRRFTRYLPWEPTRALRQWKEYADRNNVSHDVAEGLTRKVVASRLLRNLPESPEESVGMGAYAASWGLSVETMMSLIGDHSCVIVLDGELINGSYVFNGLYRAV